jgi:hypothetical protein
MLIEAKHRIKSFQKGDPQQVIEEIAKSETAVLNLKPVLTAYPGSQKQVARSS